MATSTAREDRLVELLFREGRLSDDEYREAVQTVGESGRRVGAVLVERGLISSRELYPLVRHHYESIVLDSFGWHEGVWSFSASELADKERILLEVPLPTLILEGMRSRAHPTDIEQIVSPGTRPLHVGEGICRLGDLDLLPEEAAVLDSCDGFAVATDIANKHGMPFREIAGLVAGLAVMGFVHCDAVPGDSASIIGDHTERRGERHDFRVERARVADKLAQVSEASYFAILEVAPLASGYEIRKAYRQLLSQFQPERFAVEELADLRERAALIRRVIEEAYEVLRDASLREAYRHAAEDELYRS